MNETIFKFDHGQRKMHKALGVTEQYMEDLHEKCNDALRNFVFDENKELNEDMSPSQLVEICLTQFSYSEIVLMASFFLKDNLDRILEAMNGGLPDDLMELLQKLADEQED
jgi:isoleucyl-tRNA synthetase